MIKKLISGALSAAILFTTAVTSGYIKTPGAGKTQNTHTNVDSSMDEYQLEASNSLGNYISDAMQKKEQPQSLSYRCVSEYDYDIGFAEFDRETGVLTVHSSQPADAELNISVKDDIIKTEVCNAKLHLKEGNNTVNSLKLDTAALPEFFFVDLEMFDSLNRSLCETYTINTYTQFTQEMKATDINDFDEEYVVNLDEDETTNFIVLSNDTIIGESSEDTNILVSADYENDQYVFESIDDTIRYLHEGDRFYIRPTEMDIIALSVGDITIDGDRATLTGGESAEGIFEFIKIETMSDDVSDAIVDEDEIPDNIEYNGVVEDENGEKEIACTYSSSYSYQKNDVVDDVIDSLNKRTFEIGFDIGNKIIPDNKKDTDLTKPDFSNTSIPPAKTKVKVTADFIAALKLKFEFEFNFYHKGLSLSFELKVTPSVSIDLEISGKITETIPLIKLGWVVLPGLWIGIDPEFILTVEGKMKYSPTFSCEMVFSFDTARSKKLSYTCEPLPAKDDGLEIDANVSVAFDLKPNFCIVSKKIVQIILGTPIELGVKCKTIGFSEGGMRRSNTIPQAFMFPDTSLELEDSIHSCEKCSSLEPYLKFKLEFELKVPVLEWLHLKINTKVTILEIPFNVFEKLYYSSTHKAAGWGDCPYKAYKTQFVITGTEELPAAGAEVIVDGLSATADDNGIVNFYCENGSHAYTIVVNGESVKGEAFTVDDAIQTINISLGTGDSIIAETSKIVTTQPTTTMAPVEKYIEEIPEFPEEHRYIESGRLGDYIFYYIYPNGEMSILGHGDMYDISPYIKNINTVKTVMIQDSAPDDGEYINSIGAGLFNGATSLETVYLSNHLQKIGQEAFFGCSNLKYFRYDIEDNTTKTLVLPTDLEYIGQNAFWGCNSAAFGNLVMPIGVKEILPCSFLNCKGITSINIDCNIDKIGASAFSGCGNLKEAVLGEGVKAIGDSIFANCLSLEKLTVPRVDNCDDFDIARSFYTESVADRGKVYDGTRYEGTPKSLTSITVTGGTDIDFEAFSGFSYLEEIILPDGITKIGGQAFNNCTNLNLDSDKLLKNIEYIGDYSFANCKSIKFGDTVISSQTTYIGTNAFLDCEGLTSISIEGNIDKIGASAFSGCGNLKEAVLGEGVKAIGDSIFANCLSLEKLTVPRVDNCDDFDIARSFYTESVVDMDKAYSETGYKGTPKSLTSITVTGGTEIDFGVFSGFSYLEEIILPDVITKIGGQAFYNCTNLNLDSDKLLKNANYIGSYAFFGCKSIEFGDIVIPESISSLEPNTFYDCTGITGVYFYKNIEAVGRSAFHGCDSIVNVLYEGTDEEWAEFENNIEEDNDPILRKDILTCNATAPEDKSELRIGDTNGDGEIDLADAIMIMQALCNPNRYGVNGTADKHITLEGWKRGDVDSDGLTVGDALSIQEFLLGKRKTLP